MALRLSPMPPVTGRAAVDLVLTGAVGVLVASLAFGVESAGVRVETMVFVGVLAAVSWAGRRSELRAMSAPGRGVRLGAYVLAGACEVVLLGSPGGGASSDPGGFWLAELFLALFVAGIVALTARRSGLATRALGAVVGPALVGALMWAVLLPALAGLALFVVVAVMASAAAIAGRERAVLCGLGSGALACLLIFMVSAGVYRAFPDRVDPYVLELFLGGLFGALLVAAVVRTSKA